MDSDNGMIRRNDGQTATLVYILYLVGFATGISALAGVIIAHIKSGEVSEVTQTHLDYQIRTFWIGLLMIIAGTMLSFIGIGVLILLWWVVWTLIRCIIGIIAIGDNRPIRSPETWLW